MTKKYFWGDSVGQWSARLFMLLVLPMGITALYSWYSHGVTDHFTLRLKVFGVLTMLTVVFLIVAQLKGRPLSSRALKRLRKN
jgi:peptidoglycan/LPS O-acetylase OafA/YrhL